MWVTCMRRVLVFIEGWGCREEHKRHHCRVIVKDRQGRDVALKFWRNYNKGNKVLPIDDDRANAIAVLVEYLRGGYTHAIVIVRDMRTWRLFRHYIKAIHNGEDFCRQIWDFETKIVCHRVIKTSDVHRRTKMLRFKLIITESFRVSRERIIEILRGALYFMVGVELTNEELALLIKQAHT